MVKKMVELIDMVLKDLKESGADNETLDLCRSIASWYNEGGPKFVEEEIMIKLREIKSVAKKQLKETKEVIPKKKKRKTRR